MLHDLVAKVTGRAKYSEDFRADGMLFAKLLLSPFRTRGSAASMRARRWRCRVSSPSSPARMSPSRSSRCSSAKPPRSARTRFPKSRSPASRCTRASPSSAVAAVDELTAADAIEKIKVEYEPLPWVVDPMVTLRPGGPNPRAEGNVWRPPQVADYKMPEAAVAGARRRTHSASSRRRRSPGRSATSRRASRKPTSIDRRNDRAPVDRPSADGAAHGDGLLAERQAVSARIDAVGRAHGCQRGAVGGHPAGTGRSSSSANTCGGGFGGKIPGAQTMAIPAMLSKKTGRPVMMRITREEENYIGRARAGIHLRAKIGFRKDGRITAMDMCAIGDCGPYSNQGDVGTIGSNGDRALQSREHPLPRRRGPHQHASARVSARARRRAGCSRCSSR